MPAHTYLEALGIAYRALEFDRNTAKGAANVARALGFAERQMVKTLLFETGEGEPVMILLGGDQKAISGHLKKAIGSKNVRLAGPEVIEALTGYEGGSIPPFHWQPEGFRAFMEHSLLAEEELGVGAGRWGREIIIEPADLVRATRATVVNLTDRAAPIWPAEAPGE